MLKLQEIYEKQLKYYKNHNKYATYFNELDNYKYRGSISYEIYMGNDIDKHKVAYCCDPDEIKRLESRILYHIPEYLKLYVNKNGFNAIAIGNIDNDDAWDIWMITEKGILINVQNDCKLEKNPW